MKSLKIACLVLSASLIALSVKAVQYVQSPSLAEVVRTAVGPVPESGVQELRIITWGGDIATIYANGNQVNTAPGSLFDKEGL